jgi:hypothetical protein
LSLKNPFKKLPPPPPPPSPQKNSGELRNNARTAQSIRTGPELNTSAEMFLLVTASGSNREIHPPPLPPSRLSNSIEWNWPFTSVPQLRMDGRLHLCTLVTRHMDGTHILIRWPYFTLLYWKVYAPFFLCKFQDTAIPVSTARNLCYCLHSGSLRFKCQRSNVATWHRKLSIPPTGVMYGLT